MMQDPELAKKHFKTITIPVMQAQQAKQAATDRKVFGYVVLCAAVGFGFWWLFLRGGEDAKSQEL